MSLRRPSLRTIVAICAACSLPGCGAAGEPSEREGVRVAVEEFGRAFAARDAAVICRDLLAEKLRRTVESVGIPCEEAFKQGMAGVRRPRLTVDGITLDGERASAEITTTADGQKPSHDTIELVRERGRWRVTSLAGQTEATPPAPIDPSQTGTGTGAEPVPGSD